MPQLVAIDLPQRQELLQTLRSVWDNGDAVFVVDQRFNNSLKAKALESIRPGYLINSEGINELSGSVPVADGDALVMATSGTTGFPKTVIHTFDSLRAHGEIVHRHLGIDPSRDKWIACLPLNHIGGLGVVIRAILGNIPVTIIRSPDKEELADLNNRGYNLVSLVSSVLERVDTASYKAIIIGGMAEPRRLDSNVYSTYGLTETGGGIVYRGEPLDGVEIKIQPETQLIEIRSPTLLRGYRSLYSSQAQGYMISASGIDPDLKDGYFVTSDCGYLSDGNLKILGRKDDLINTGGEKIWAKSLEDIISAIKGVTQVCVIGIPDDKWGQKIVAAIVKSDLYRITESDVVKAVKSELPGWAVPKIVKFLSDLPRTTIGKIDRAAVSRLFSKPIN